MRILVTLGLATGLALASLGVAPDRPERDPAVRVILKPPRRTPAAAAMDPLRRILACQRLTNVDSSQAAEALIILLQDDDALVRAHAAQALSRHRGPLVVGALCKALGSADWHLRRCAAQALGVLGDPAAAPVLRRLAASDPDPGVREQAKAALTSLTDDAAWPHSPPPAKSSA